MAGSTSDPFDVSTEPINEEELRHYQYASNVNVSNFISVSLLTKSNYTTWKTQMLCLLDSHNLRVFVDATSAYLPPEIKSPNIIAQYERLVTGWLFRSLNEDMLKHVINWGCRGPREIWSALETICHPKAGYHVSEPINEEELRYLYASNVNVSNFVSVKLLGERNYDIWKKQMLCLLETLNLRGLVDADSRFKLPEFKSSTIMEQYKTLVEGWIYGSLNENVLRNFKPINVGPQKIWSALERAYHQPKAGDGSRDPTGSGSSTTELPKPIDFTLPIKEEELRYLYASNVNVSNFVSVSLLTKSNYTTWKRQMLCLLDIHNLRGFVDDTVGHPAMLNPYINTQYQTLITSWLIHSVDEVELRGDPNLDVLHSKNVKLLWRMIEISYAPKEDSKDDDLMELFPKQVKVTTTLPDTTPPPDNDKLLVKAVADGRWLEAKFILKNNKDDASKARDMIIIAVREGQNDFLERLLDFIDQNKIKLTDEYGWTFLEYAAKRNNKRAAQLLVKNFKSLLFCREDRRDTLLQTALTHNSLDTFLYLWEAVNNEQGKPKDINHTEMLRPIKFDILEDAISTKQYDIASRFVDMFPQVAMQNGRLLMAMARTFPSDLGFGEALICPSLNNFHLRIVKRSSLLFNAPGVLYAWADDVLWTTRSFKKAMWLLQETLLILLVPVAVLYPLYQLMCLLILLIIYPFFMLYFLLWMVLAIAVTPIKRIEKKRKTYQEAKELVNIICNHIDKLGHFDGIHPCYEKPIEEAVCQGAYEIFDEILSRVPDLIWFRDEEGLDFIKLAIINRSEKIYNFIYHMNVKMDLYRAGNSYRDNVLHMAGKLAPERILSRTTGAALQLQRELQWFQEVEKFMLPRDLVKKNANKETPHMVFTREHADLVKEGEKWMKTTSEACSITAALIVTIVFAAAITVPGGNDQEKGIPLFTKEIAFYVFAVCDAISLFSGASALLVFLSILTTRFAEIDFLVSLPIRLIIGLCTLFLSTASMMVAFGAILFLVFCDQRPWMLAPIGGLACMPIAVIVFLQLPLLVDLFQSTYIPIFGKQKYIASGKFISGNPRFIYEL